MYVPGPWLRRGKNEIVILDLTGPENPVVGSLNHPILNELHPEKDFQKTHRPVVKLNLDSATPVHTGSFAPGMDTQEIKFAVPATGKYFCLEGLNAHDGKPYAAVAELDLLDANGQPISHNGWTIAYVDSEERAGEDGTAENANLIFGPMPQAASAVISQSFEATAAGAQPEAVRTTRRTHGLPPPDNLSLGRHVLPAPEHT